MLQKSVRGQYVKKLDVISSLGKQKLCMEESGTDCLVRNVQKQLLALIQIVLFHISIVSMHKKKN